MRITIYTFIIFLSFVSCSEKEGVLEEKIIYNIDIRSAVESDKQLVKLSDLADKITYIPLETNNNCLLTKISYLHLNEDFIFVSDTKALYQFDNKGNFLRQISKLGNGPKEHGKRIRFEVDDFNSEIYIFSYPNKILVNRLETGEFIRSFNVSFEVANFEISSNGDLVFFTKEFNHILNPSLVEIFIVDKYGNVKDSISNQNREKNRSNYIGYVHTYKLKQDIMFMGTYKNILYKFTANNKSNRYAVFDFQNEVSWDKLIIEPGMGNKLDNYLNIVKITETTDYLFLTVHQGIRAAGKAPEVHQVLYNKISNELLFVKDIENNIDDGPSFWPSFVVDGKLVAYFLPYEFIKNKNEGENQSLYNTSSNFPIKTITENDNPILAIIE